MSIRTRSTATVLAAATVAGTAGIAALIGTGAAQAMPTEHDATANIVVNNDTDSTMFFDGGSTPDGHWVDAPIVQIAPHTSDTVSVAANGGGDGVGAELAYHLSGNSMAPRGDVTLVANDYASGADTAGTRWAQPLTADSVVQTGHPTRTRRSSTPSTDQQS